MAQKISAKAPANKEPTKPAPRSMRPQTARQRSGARVTTAIVLRPYTLEVYQRVAALRGAQGQTDQSEAGVERPYSVSALIREALEAQLPELEAELKKVGIKVTEQPGPSEGGE